MSLRIELKELSYGIVHMIDDQPENLIALCRSKQAADDLVKDKPELRVVEIKRNDWTSASLSWNAVL